jgi:hypothetical protein
MEGGWCSQTAGTSVASAPALPARVWLSRGVPTPHRLYTLQASHELHAEIKAKGAAQPPPPPACHMYTRGTPHVPTRSAEMAALRPQPQPQLLLLTSYFRCFLSTPTQLHCLLPSSSSLCLPHRVLHRATRYTPRGVTTRRDQYGRPCYVL